MSIDVTRETLRTLPEAARMLRKHRDTVRAWVEHGRKGVKLEAVLLPGGLHTSDEAIRRFVARLSGGAQVGEREAPRPPAAEGRAHADARRAIAEAGWD